MFGIQCSSCGAENRRGSRFCSECGNPLSGMVCSSCGKPIQTASKFCPECGAKLHAPIGSTSTVAPDTGSKGSIRVWQRRPDDFANRFEVADIAGVFSRKLTIEQGTKAIFLQGGRYTGVLPAGTYEVGGLLKAIRELNISEKATVVMVDDGDVPVTFAIGTLRTKENFPAGVKGKMVANIDNPVLFFTNFMKGREHVAVTDLGLLVRNEMLNVLQSKIRDYSFEDLYGNAALKKEIEQDFAYHLTTTLGRLGMQLIHLPYFDYDESYWEEIVARRAEFVRENITRRESIKKDAEMRLMEFEQQISEKRDRVAFEEEDEGLERRRADLAAKIRARLTADAVDEFRNADDLEQFLYAIDTGRVIRDNEMMDLKRLFEENRDDHALARKLTIRRIELGHELDLERERQAYARESAEAAAQSRIRIEEEEDLADHRAAQRGIDILNAKKKVEREDAAGYHALELEQRQKEADIEVQRVQARSRATEEALISMATGKEGEQIAEIARMKAAQDLSEEQIMALGAKESASVADAQKEKYRAAQAREMYEQRLADKDEHAQRIRDIERQNQDRMERILGKSLEEMGSTASTRAQAAHVPGTTVVSGSGGAQPVIIGENTVPLRSQPHTEKIILCSSCNAELPVGTKFCTHCGTDQKK